MSCQTVPPAVFCFDITTFVLTFQAQQHNMHNPVLRGSFQGRGEKYGTTPDWALVITAIIIYIYFLTYLK